MTSSTQVIHNIAIEMTELAAALELAASNHSWSTVAELYANLSVLLVKGIGMLSKVSPEDAMRCAVHYNRLHADLLERYGERLGLKGEAANIEKVSDVEPGELAHKPPKRIMRHIIKGKRRSKKKD